MAEEKKKRVVKKKEATAKAGTGNHKGRVSVFAGRKLYKTEKNPHRPGTACSESFQLIRDGISYEAFRKAGGNRLHLANLIKGKYVEARKE